MPQGRLETENKARTLRVRNIRRFAVTLNDGTELPIPEKKYTAFRDRAKERMQQK